MDWRKALDLVLEEREIEVVDIDPKGLLTLRVKGPGLGLSGLGWEMKVEAPIQELFRRGLREVEIVSTPGVMGLLWTGGEYREWEDWGYDPVTLRWEGTAETSSEFAEEMGYPKDLGEITTKEMLQKLKNYLGRREITLEKIPGGGLKIKAYTPPK